MTFQFIKHFPILQDVISSDHLLSKQTSWHHKLTSTWYYIPSIRSIASVGVWTKREHWTDSECLQSPHRIWNGPQCTMNGVTADYILRAISKSTNNKKQKKTAKIEWESKKNHKTPNRIHHLKYREITECNIERAHIAQTQCSCGSNESGRQFLKHSEIVSR